jgi:hypothetical protein
MNAENPVQIDLFGVSATRTKDTRLAEHTGGSLRCYGSGCRDDAIGRQSPGAGPRACLAVVRHAGARTTGSAAVFASAARSDSGRSWSAPPPASAVVGGSGHFAGPVTVGGPGYAELHDRAAP